MHRVGVLTGHVVRSGRNIVRCRQVLETLRSVPVRGGGSDDDGWDDDDELDALLAAQALGVICSPFAHFWLTSDSHFALLTRCFGRR